MNISILGNGCVKEHAIESRLFEYLKNNGINISNSLDESDYFIYVTCAGVGDTIKKCIDDIKMLNMYSKKSDIKIIITGCLVKHHGYLFDKLKANPNMKFIDNTDWLIPVINYIMNDNKKNTSKIKLYNRTKELFYNNTHIQFLLEEGCNNHCTFCKVHYNDQKIESIPYDLALNHVKKMISNGTKIIDINGDNTALYGINLYNRCMLHDFIHEISLLDGIEIIRINELVPGNMYPKLLEEIISNQKVKSISMQLESGSDRILKLMNRNYTLKEYDDYVLELSKAGKYIDTILMSAFPTESYEDLDMAIEYVKKRNIIIDGICKYSDFEYIPSSHLEQLSEREKSDHHKYLCDKIKIHNINLFNDNMIKQNNLILIGSSKGYNVFECNIPNILCISKSKKYENIPLGTIVDASPKLLVKKSNFNNRSIYRV